jgi:hypothetical protein
VAVTEDDIEDAMAQILREGIDKGIVMEVRCLALTDQGWTMVKLAVADLDDVGPWMQANILGDWRGFPDRWLFEHADDATLFTMRFG